MKKALGLSLAPGEERLCYESYVDVDAVQPMDLQLALAETYP